MNGCRLPATARRGHKGHLDRGAAAVEMALVMPLLILMVMGIIDFGRIFNGEIQLSQAAREGARIAALGASGPYDTAAVVTRTKAALTNPALQADLLFSGSPSCVSTDPTGCIGIVVVTAGGDRAGVCLATDSKDNYSKVTVTIPYTKILFGPDSLSQKAVMKCSG